MRSGGPIQPTVTAQRQSQSRAPLFDNIDHHRAGDALQLWRRDPEDTMRCAGGCPDHLILEQGRHEPRALSGSPARYTADCVPVRRFTLSHRPRDRRADDGSTFDAHAWGPDARIITAVRRQKQEALTICATVCQARPRRQLPWRAVGTFVTVP